MKKWKYLTMTAVMGSALMLGACGSDSAQNGNNAETNAPASSGQEAADEKLQGAVAGDGSSTVAPIIEAVVEEYAGTQPDVKVSVGFLVLVVVLKNSSQVKQTFQMHLVI